MSHSATPHQKKKNKNSFHSESHAHTDRGVRLSRSPKPEAISSRGLAQGWMLRAKATGRGAQRGAHCPRGLRGEPAAARRLPLAHTASSGAHAPDGASPTRGLVSPSSITDPLRLPPTSRASCSPLKCTRARRSLLRTSTMIKRNLMETDTLSSLPIKTYALRKQRVAGFNANRAGWSPHQLVQAAEQGTATFHKPDARLLFKVKSRCHPRKSSRSPPPLLSALLLPEALLLHGTFSTLYSSCAYNHSLSDQVCVPQAQAQGLIQSRCSMSDDFVFHWKKAKCCVNITPEEKEIFLVCRSPETSVKPFVLCHGKRSLWS